MPEKKKNRIGNIMCAVMIFIALIFDALGFLFAIPFLGAGIITTLIITPIEYILFWFLFKINGVGFLTRGASKRLAAMVIPFIVELIPEINALPVVTIGIIVTLVLVRIEDRSGVNVEEIEKIAKGDLGALKDVGGRVLSREKRRIIERMEREMRKRSDDFDFGGGEQLAI
jgi:hypothetical protein